MGVAASQRKNAKPIDIVHASGDQSYINKDILLDNIINKQVIEQYEQIQEIVVPMLQEQENIRMTQQYEGNLFPKIKQRPLHIQFDCQSAYVLGEGSYGQVYSCLDKYTGKKLAIKTFLPTQDNMESVLWEASIIAYLRNENIIKIFDYSEGQQNNAFDQTTERQSQQNFTNQPYIVMEQVPFSLSELCKQFNGFPEVVVTKFMYQIVKAIQFCHSRSIAHLDIKAGNIMLDSSFHPVLMDFGTAVRASGPLPLGVRGSPSWLAPEILKEAKYDPFKADVWSLGCTLIELLDGRPPYSYLTQVPAILYHVSQLEEAPKPNTFVTEKCAKFLAKCLVLDPEKRCSVDELIDDPFFSNVAKSLQIDQKQQLQPIYVDIQTLQENNKLALEASSENTQTSELSQDVETSEMQSQADQHIQRPDELQKLYIDETEFDGTWPTDEDLKCLHDDIFEQKEIIKI